MNFMFAPPTQYRPSKALRVRSKTELACAVAMVWFLSLQFSVADDKPEVGVPIAFEVNTCRGIVEKMKKNKVQTIDPSSIKVLSWNINKGLRPKWRDDWQNLTKDVDIALVQEAEMKMALTENDDQFAFGAFSPGYRTKSLDTGVLTLSTHTPISQCNLQHFEPWLRTPKAILITEFPIAEHEHTLLIVNLHAINFSIGVKEFSEQFKDISLILRSHEGPLIFAGDFNAWRQKRMAVVHKLVNEFGLDTVIFDPDHRRRLNGLPFSNFFTRGLIVERSLSWSVSSSDHNPIFAEFSIIAE